MRHVRRVPERYAAANLSLWDLVYELGATPVGVETYANSRRMEKSLRLQNADLLTEYNLYEAGLARPKVRRRISTARRPT